MKTLKRSILLSTLLAIVMPFTAASAAKIFEQEGCADGNTVCETISNETQAFRNLRSFSFAVADFGRAEVSLQGSMLCSSVASTPAVVDVVTQITTVQAGEPVINGPGGARHAAVLINTADGTTTSFNLASRRVMFVPPGQSVVNFNVQQLRMDAGTSCIFYNLAFSVVYVEG